jgi:hypothetical protein
MLPTVVPRTAVPPLAAACLVAVVVGGTAPAHAQMGPALNSFVTYVKTDRENCGAFTFAAKRPPGVKRPVTAPIVTQTAVGRYAVTAPGAAPLPGASPRAGFFVDVTAVGGNARCFEEGAFRRGEDFLSNVRCVDPQGTPRAAEFSWSYRADSLDFVQYAEYRANFGYAEVDAAGALFSHFSPAPGARITVEKRGTGQYRVTFGGLGTASASMDRARGADVQISNICKAPACATTACVTADWSVGRTSSFVDVRCADLRAGPADAAFRVYIGQEAMNSQEEGSPSHEQAANEGVNYGWVNASDVARDVVYASKSHARRGFRKVVTARTGRGKYNVRFEDQIIYGPTCWALHVTAHTARDPAYCVVDGTDHEKNEVHVGCYDRDGAPRDAPWSLSMRRQYNN